MLIRIRASRFAPVCVATVIGCAEIMTERPEPAVLAKPPASAIPSASAGGPMEQSAASIAPPGPSGTAFPPASSQEEIERMNVGCKYRRSTNIVSTCAKADPASKPARIGAWTPSEKDVAAIFGASSACYCASDLDALARDCMRKAKTSIIEITIGKPDDPTDCSVTVSAAESKGRRFVRLDAINRDVATFYSTITIDEVVGGARKNYIRGYNSIEESSIVAGESGVSKELQSEWSKLPNDLQGWILGR